MNTEKEFDAALTLQDRLRLELNRYGEKNVPLTVGELATRIGEPRNYNVYQALTRLKRLGEIDFQKEDNKIIGITINKLEPSGRTYQRAAEAAKANVNIKDIPTKDIATHGMVALTEYANKRLAIIDMQEKARQAGLDPDETVKFEPNPLAEEGLALMQLLSASMEENKALKAELQQTKFDLEAEKRNVDFLQQAKKNKLREEIFATAAAN